MTEATTDTGSAAPAASATSRGRPRPDATIDRDTAVLAHLRQNGPRTRKQLVEDLSKPGNEIYLSLYRLSRKGDAKREGTQWSAVSAETAPTE